MPIAYCHLFIAANFADLRKFNFVLLIAYCLLLIAYCLLLIAHCYQAAGFFS